MGSGSAPSFSRAGLTYYILHRSLTSSSLEVVEAALKGAVAT